VRMLNAGPDIPFAGFPINPADMTDPATTGQVMEFEVNQPALASDALTTALRNLVLPAERRISQPVAHTRQVSLNELESDVLCTTVAPDGSVSVVPGSTPPSCNGGGESFGPRQALLGTVDTTAGTSTPLHWMEPITENPILGDTEIWEIYNMTMDGHPIHLHLVRFEVVNRQPLQIDPSTMSPIPVVDESVAPEAPKFWEIGFHDMVTALPGQVTRIKAHFDIVGTYVWHCHIVEHEDNEMMRPYLVRLDPNNPDINQDGAVDVTDLRLMQVEANKALPRNPGYDLNGDGKVNILDVWFLLTKLHP
jgi:spore coat protein A, manganese oxidase